MNIKKTLVLLFVLLFMFLLLLFSDESIKGAVRGLVMCSDIVIPSLFPFGVCALFLYNSGFFSLIELKLSPLSRFLFGINGKNLCIFIMSFLGGYPIGAILIENLYSNKEISKRNAENMLAYCINSGPAFVILGVGKGVFSNIKIGVLLFISNFLASLILAFILKKFSSFEPIYESKAGNDSLTDSFVESTARSSKSILSVCSFVILFSTIIGVISALPIDKKVSNIICGLLEITNACVVLDKNIYLLSFLLGFGGLCIHFQILSVLKTLKPPYIKIVIGRIVHGLLCVVNSLVLFKVFPVSLETLAQNQISYKLSSLSLPFSAALIFMCATFLLSFDNKGRNI